MNRLHGLVKSYAATNSPLMSSDQPKQQAISTLPANAPDRTRSRPCSTMATNHGVLLSFATLIIFYSATLCQSQSTTPVAAPKSIPYGTVLTPRKGLEALAPYSKVSRKPSFQSAITPSSVASVQQPLAAESSNIVHKFKFAFHNRPHGRLIEDDDEMLDEQPVNLMRNSRQYENALPYSSGRVHRYLPGSTSAIYVDSSEELVDDFVPAQQPRAQSRRNLARENYIVTDQNSGQMNSDNNTFKNFVIPLPTHRLNDRSLATGVIVISQDNGFPSFRDSGSDDRQFHYELLSIPQKDKSVDPNAMIKETKSSTGFENKSNESPNEWVPEVEPEVENSSAEKNAEIGKREIERVFVPENDSHDSRRKVNDKLAALTIMMENKHNLEAPKPSQSPPTDYIASSLKARIHLSRPSTNSFNINLVKTTSTTGEQLANETQGSLKEQAEPESKLSGQRVTNSEDGPSLLLLVERETMLNKIRKNVKKASRKVTEGYSKAELTTEANTVVRPRRRQSRPSSTINLNTALSKNNFILKQRRNDKLMRLNMTISESGNSTERPTELTTTSILNSLVKELNLALKDRLRQLESFNQTMTSTAATSTNFETSSVETTTALSKTTTELAEVKTTTTEANSRENDSTADARSSEDSAEVAFMTTTSPATESASGKRSAISSEEDASEEVNSAVAEAVATTTVLPELITTDSLTTGRNSAEDSSEDVSSTTTVTSTTSPVTSLEEMTSSEEVSEEANTTTTQTTTTTAVPTTTTTTTTTTQAPTTKSTTKRESRKKQKGLSAPIASISIKKSKKSSQLKSGSSSPAESSSKATSKSSLKTFITVKSADIDKSNDTETIKLKMSVALPKNKTSNAEEPLKRVRSVSTTAKPKTEPNKPLRFSFDITSSPTKKKDKLEITTQATTKWSQDPRKQLVWSFWNPSTTAKPATTERGAMPAENIVVFERRPPGPPKIPNNFGFANTIRDPEHIFDEESDESDEVDETRQKLAKRLSVSEPKTLFVVEKPVSLKSANVKKEQPKKVERERDFEDDDSEGDDEDDLADTNVPGTPGVDYPVLGHIPDTGFDCSKQQYPGFYSDMEVGCQVYHSCSLASIAQPELAVDQIGASSSISTHRADQTSGEYPFLVAESSPALRRIPSSRKSGLNGGKHSFLCPNGTIFSQEYLICDWWYNVKCDESPRFYPLNRDVFTSGQQNSNHHIQTMASASSPVSDTVMPSEFRTTHYHDRISRAPSRDANASLLSRPPYPTSSSK